MSFSLALSIQLARGDVGYHETGNNCQKYSYAQSGVRCQNGGWCVSAIWKWLRDAGYDWRELGFTTQGTASSGALMRAAQAHGLWRDKRTYTAQAGDVLVFSLNSPHDHSEMVEADGGPGYEQRFPGRHRFATIGGNTNDQVMHRSRWERDVLGIVAFSQSKQVTSKPLTPKEIKKMGIVAIEPVPGARTQNPKDPKHPWKARQPSVAARLNPDGTWDLLGLNGTQLREQTSAGLGVSVYRLGKLAAPIKSIAPTWLEVRTRGGTYKWSGDIVALADDGGTFHMHNPKINYVK